MKAQSHPHADRGLDLYESPPEAVRALLGAEWLPRRIWEPACGPGAIVRVLRAAGHDVIASDVQDYGCPAQNFTGDFLAQRSAPFGAECIVTNPPFKLAGEFVAHGLTLCPRVVMLLRLAFLESERRRPILDNDLLARVLPFRNRLPMMHRDSWAGPRSSNSIAHAWFVWDLSHRGPTQMHRISWQALDACEDRPSATTPCEASGAA